MLKTFEERLAKGYLGITFALPFSEKGEIGRKSQIKRVRE